MSASTKTVPCHRTVAVKSWLAVVFSSLCVFSFVSSIQRAWQEFRRPLADLFRVVCPQFVEHRWQYLYECVQWVLSRKAALQYLKLNDIAQSGERDSGESDKHQLSSRHLELLANLSASNEQSLRFWTTAGLTMILATWGHRVSGYLHSCPCHPLPSNKDANRERAKQRDRLWVSGCYDQARGCMLPNGRQDGGRPCVRLCTACSRQSQVRGDPSSFAKFPGRLEFFWQ